MHSLRGQVFPWSDLEDMAAHKHVLCAFAPVVKTRSTLCMIKEEPKGHRWIKTLLFSSFRLNNKGYV